MSLERKDPTLRVATEEPHLVSLGGGRLSTGVSIHHLPIGELVIGSSLSCGVVLSGSSVRPQHCTLYRSEANEITLVPEKNARTLVDGNKIVDEVVLTQGSMLTIGKSNYIRFNNPQEAKLIKSTMGSNERVSMSQIDFSQDSSSSNSDSPDDVFKNLYIFLESQTNSTPSSVKNKPTTTTGSFYDQLPNDFEPMQKVFPSTVATGNTPAKDVLGTKYNNYVKNLPQNSVNYSQNMSLNNEKFVNGITNPKSPVFTKINNNLGGRGSSGGYDGNGAGGDGESSFGGSNGSSETLSPKLQPISACYDRYPKPGSYGSLQTYSLNSINLNLNGSSNIGGGSLTQPEQNSEYLRQKALYERKQEEEMSKREQERLEEIIRLCADYEKQNSPITNSPIVQNRIKTNGSLPRDKKLNAYGELGSPFSDHSTSPSTTSPQHATHQPNLFFPTTGTIIVEQNQSKKKSSGYENVSFIHERMDRNALERSGSSDRIPSVPPSPRTKIKTCVSPSNNNDRRNEYDLLTQSFEDRLRLEIKNLRDNRSSQKYGSGAGETGDSNGTKELSRKRIGEDHEDLRKRRDVVVDQIRELKTEISELQRQEQEVFREFDLEKVLVSAELSTELGVLEDLEKNYQKLLAKIHRLEAQHNSSRTLQETQQAKLKQSIDMKKSQIDGLEKIIATNKNDDSLRDELNTIVEVLDNEKKMFEDLEFHYFEEESEWMAQREEFNTELKHLIKTIDEKKYQIKNLEISTIDNQNIAMTDTKKLEENLFALLKDLERCREELKDIDCSLTGFGDQGANDDDINRHLISQHKNMFGSNEILSTTGTDEKRSFKDDIMSKSVNENMINAKNIEMSGLTEFRRDPNNKRLNMTPQLSFESKSSSMSNESIERRSSPSTSSTSTAPVLFHRQNASESDPLLKLKYNLSSPTTTTPPNLDVTVQQQQSQSKSSSPPVNLNLSLESDDFEVNPLDKRIPSQDDIDRISKVTLDAPIITQGAANHKVIESIKEIERNRQLLLAQQGTHVIEHERQKMNELRQKSYNEARAQYAQLQQSDGMITSTPENDKSRVNTHVTGSYYAKDRSLEQGEKSGVVRKSALKNTNENRLVEGEDRSSNTNNQRHSHPEFDPTQHRPLSEISEISLLDKSFLSQNDVRNSNNVFNNSEDSCGTGGDQTEDDSNRNSFASQTNDDGTSPQQQLQSKEYKSRLVSGGRRNNTTSKSQRPLTRYLPIMSSHLDLRQHVEKAGHQITLCPHVIINENSCRGYLHKLGATFHGWSKRWFVFDRNQRAFIYYSDKSERKPRGGAYFPTIDDVYLDHLNTSRSGRPHCTFIVKTKKRSYHLQAASDAAARIWIDVIITGAQGNIDY